MEWTFKTPEPYKVTLSFEVADYTIAEVIRMLGVIANVLDLAEKGYPDEDGNLHVSVDEQSRDIDLMLSGASLDYEKNRYDDDSDCAGMVIVGSVEKEGNEAKLGMSKAFCEFAKSGKPLIKFFESETDEIKKTLIRLGEIE